MMDDYQKANVRVWAMDSSLAVNRGKKRSLNKILADARVIHNFLTDAPPAEVLKLAKDADNGR